MITTSPPGDLAPDTDLLVRPVYLAGRGDTATVYDALCDARGWGKAITATGLMFTSPRQDAQVAYLPESRYGGWKAIQYREPLGTPLWWASFSRNTPAEITSAFTTALAECLPSNHRDFLHGGPRHRPSSPAGALADRGWQTDDTAMYLYQRSPDGHAYFSLRKGHLDDYMELEGEGPAQWTMYGCVDQVNGERWHADFASATPLYLVRRPRSRSAAPSPSSVHCRVSPSGTCRTSPYRPSPRAPTRASRPRSPAHPKHPRPERLRPVPRPPPARLRLAPRIAADHALGEVVLYDLNDERWREYHVAPRYLAGSTFTGDPALRPLLDAGWKLNHDGMGNVYVNAPDQTVRLGYLPEGDDDALWKVTAYSDPFAMPRWLVTFQESTPPR
ncbi:DUF317 domain-containing protein [Streptomyces sp. NPDC005195]|uniref:DUF317 domain-containing protein n=1 Tax=Streptomyces sp. NPDC005195 TaxID=3154561 RepID=UPI0033AB592F